MEMTKLEREADVNIPHLLAERFLKELDFHDIVRGKK